MADINTKLKMTVDADVTPAKRQVSSLITEVEAGTKKILDNGKSWKHVGEELKVIHKTAKDVTEEITEQGKIITTTVRSYDQLVDKAGKLRTLEGKRASEDYKLNEQVIKKEIKTLYKEQQQLEKNEKEIKKVAQANKELATSTNSVTTHTSKATSAIKLFADTFMKMARFNTINLIYDAFVDSIKESIEVVQEFDKALIEFRKVSDLSGQALDDYVNKLGELGEAVAKTRTEMVQASTEFKKSGYSDEDSAELAQIAMLYSNIADSELSAGDSASYIISQMKAFGYTTAQEAQSIIDKTNEVRLI